MPLQLDTIKQAGDGSTSIDQFKAFIEDKVSKWDEYMVGDIPEKCSQVFDEIDPSRTDFFAVPEPFRVALFKMYGLDPHIHVNDK